MTPTKRSHNDRLSFFVRRLQIHAAKGETAFIEYLLNDPGVITLCATVLHYQAGRHNEAARLLAAFEAGPNEMVTLDTPICDSPVGIRTANMLADGLGIVTFRDLRNVTAERLASIPNVGPTLIADVRRVLAEAVANS